MATLAFKDDRVIYTDGTLKKVIFGPYQYGGGGGKFYVQGKGGAHLNVDPSTLGAGQQTVGELEDLFENQNAKMQGYDAGVV